MSALIRRELDLARLAARERRLRLVMQILDARQAESRREGVPVPAGLRQSIAGFGDQLGDVHRRQAELARMDHAALGDERGRAGGRTGSAGSAFTAPARDPESDPRELS